MLTKVQMKHTISVKEDYYTSNCLNQWFPKWAVPPLGGGEKL